MGGHGHTAPCARPARRHGSSPQAPSSPRTSSDPSPPRPRRPRPAAGGGGGGGGAGPPRARLTGSEEQDPLAGKGGSRDLERPEESCEGDGGRSLNIVIETRDPVAVPIEPPERVGVSKIPPLEEGLPED